MNKVADRFKQPLLTGKCVVLFGVSCGTGLAITRGFAALGAQADSVEPIENEDCRRARESQVSKIAFHRFDVRGSVAVAAWIRASRQIDVLIDAQGRSILPDIVWRSRSVRLMGFSHAPCS